MLSRRPSRGGLIGLNSWHAKIVSANQDFHFQSPYLSIYRSALHDISWRPHATSRHGHARSFLKTIPLRYDDGG